MQLLLPLASIHEVRLSSGDAEARVQGRWRFAMAVISAALSLAWCVGASWFFAGDSGTFRHCTRRAEHWFLVEFLLVYYD